MPGERDVTFIKNLTVILTFISLVFGAFFAIDNRIDKKIHDSDTVVFKAISESQNTIYKVYDSKIDSIANDVSDTKAGIKRIEDILLRTNK